MSLSSLDDEPVSLRGICYFKILQNYYLRNSPAREDKRFLAAVAETILDPSCTDTFAYNWCDACELIALHTPTIDVTSTRQDAFLLCENDLADIVGAPPGPAGTLYGQNCDVCDTPGFSTSDGENCEFGLPISCPIDLPAAFYDTGLEMWVCLAECPMGFILVDDACMSDAIIL